MCEKAGRWLKILMCVDGPQTKFCYDYFSAGLNNLINDNHVIGTRYHHVSFIGSTLAQERPKPANMKHGSNYVCRSKAIIRHRY